MNPEEYARLDRIDTHHWFYAGKRRIVTHWIDRIAGFSSDNLLVDCGAGTGRFAAEVSTRCRVIAIDDHHESLEILRRRLPPDSIREGSCASLPVGDSVADYVTALDVIEHIDDDRTAVREMVRVLKPNGLLVITVPAFPALWSDWDVGLHHKRRYLRPGLRELLLSEGVTLRHLAYINVAAFPAVLAIRKLRGNRPHAEGKERSEDAIPPKWLNRLLYRQYVSTACQSLIPFPFGVGLLAVGQKI